MYTFVKMLHNILGWNIMHIQQNINTDVEINSLTDLPKLKVLLESSNMKINKSQLARELGVDRRTVDNILMVILEKQLEISRLKLTDFMILFNHCCQMNHHRYFIINAYYGNI